MQERERGDCGTNNGPNRGPNRTHTIGEEKQEESLGQREKEHETTKSEERTRAKREEGLHGTTLSI